MTSASWTIRGDLHEDIVADLSGIAYQQYSYVRTLIFWILCLSILSGQRVILDEGMKKEIMSEYRGNSVVKEVLLCGRAVFEVVTSGL